MSKTVILDNGCNTIKVGYAGDKKPKFVLPNIIGIPKYKPIQDGNKHSDIYISNAAFEKAGILDFHYPISDGIITDWDKMELIWRYTFDNELKKDSSSSPIFFTDSFDNSLEQRRKIAQIAFEKFNVPSLFFESNDLLTISSVPNQTGLVIDSGESRTIITGISNGQRIANVLTTNRLAGRTLTSYLVEKINERQTYLRVSSDRFLAQNIKESICYVVDDYKTEREKSKTSDKFNYQYEFPDGNQVAINELRFKVPEFLFKPKLWGFEFTGITDLINETIAKADPNIRNDLYSNIILTGGNTLFKGFPERLQAELSKTNPSVNVKVVAEKDRQFSAWKAASQKSKSSEFKSLLISKHEFQEKGVEVIKKCA